MPLRHATLNHQLQKNGARLHAAMMIRVHSHGADGPPSEGELELMEERRQLKAARDERREHDQQPKAHAPKLVRTTHALAKPKEAKAAKEKEAKAAKKAKPHMTRTEKHAQKAAALDAARRAAKKSASKT